MFKRLVLTLCFLSGTVGVCGAGREADETKKKGRPDLSGTWVLEKGKDNKSGKAGVTLSIVQSEPEIKVTRKVVSGGSERTQELVYYTDSRGEVNPTLSGRGTIRTKTKWSGNTLVIKEHFAQTPAGRGLVREELTEKWGVSSDGQTLTQRQEFSVSEQRSMPDASASGGVETAGSITVLGSDAVIKRVYKRSGRAL